MLRRFLGLAALVAGAVLLVAVVGALAVSRWGDGGEAPTGRLALQIDAVTDRPYVSPPPRARPHAASGASGPDRDSRPSASARR